MTPNLREMCRKGRKIIGFWRFLNKKIMRLRGIEPPHAAPEATALSTELQTHHMYNTTSFHRMQVGILKFTEKWQRRLQSRIDESNLLLYKNE